ncbi:hypothetical protein [Pseudomonas sp. Au-Pse12]|uniref:hypothetical protein n=1 Tax=Pseudomonas sp. Au-Pse12 TaxID=2906459 RepID=UPI001E4FF16D|nr:hypothetical protein [Pseudomonas sp. Au-Pse12]
MTMNAYKIMRKRYYAQGSTVLTKNAQYGNRIRRSTASLALAEAAIDVCSDTDATFEQIINLLQNLQMTRGGFHLPPSVRAHHAERLEPLSIEAPSILAGDFGATFWESLYERVRRDEKPSCPSRMDSYFACRDSESLGRYKAKHWLNKMDDKLACEITISDCPVVFEADMVVLDEIDGTMTFASATPQILRYWNQEFTKRPIVEALLQGCVVLGAEVEI